jgi:hypothetical protein
MDVEIRPVFDRIKRCVQTGKARAIQRQYQTVRQEMEEIEALIDILERKLEGVNKNESGTQTDANGQIPRDIQKSLGQTKQT